MRPDLSQIGSIGRRYRYLPHVKGAGRKRVWGGYEVGVGYSAGRLRPDGRATVTDVLERKAATLSPLFRMAVLKGVEASVLLHIRRGAPVNGCDDRGRTPLMLAAAAGRHQICLLLLSEGADAACLDNDGRSAGDMAEADGHIALAAALRPAKEVRPAEEVVVKVPDAEPVEEADTGGWLADTDVSTPDSDLSLTTTVAEVQDQISSHRVARAEDAWTAAEISIPLGKRAGRPAPVLPRGVENLLASAMGTGRISEVWLERAFAGAAPGQMHLVRNVLDAAGVEVEPAGFWNKAVPPPERRDRAEADEVQEAVDLLENLVEESVELYDIYKTQTDGLAAFGRDEEERLFRTLGDARRALVQALNAGSGAFLAWLEAEDVGGGDADDEDFDEEDGEGVSSADQTDLRKFLDQSAWAEGETVAPPYAALARLLESGAVGEVNEMIVGQVRKALFRYRQARDRIAGSNLKLVPWLAWRYRRHGLPLMDLVQEGNMGLLRAIDRFDPARGNRFSTYAVWWIRQSISRGIADQARIIRVPVHMLETVRVVERARRELDNGSRRQATAEDLADKLFMPLEKVRKVLRIVPDPVSLEVVPDETDFEDRDVVSPFEAFASSSLREITARVLSSLTPREERVLRMRFGISSDLDHTLEEVGQLFDVTRERIRQIEAKALRKLKHPSRSRRLRSFLDA